MVEQTKTNYINKNPRPSAPSKAEADEIVMSKIWKIIGRGNNAEVKQAKDGSLAVMEVKKHIV